jgi:hypothetical protein
MPTKALCNVTQFMLQSYCTVCERLTDSVFSTACSCSAKFLAACINTCNTSIRKNGKQYVVQCGKFQWTQPSMSSLSGICRSNLMFMGPCVISIFQYTSNKMQRYTVYSYLETALHVSGGTSTHHQERKQVYLQHQVFVTPLLLHVAIASFNKAIPSCIPETFHKDHYHLLITVLCHGSGN